MGNKPQQILMHRKHMLSLVVVEKLIWQLCEGLRWGEKDKSGQIACTATGQHWAIFSICKILRLSVSDFLACMVQSTS